MYQSGPDGWADGKVVDRPPGLGGAGQLTERGSPGCLMCPALKRDFPKQGSPIRTSIRMQMKVFANQIHLLLFVCEMRVNTVLGGRKLMGPGRP